jgi:hypothetical protein
MFVSEREIIIVNANYQKFLYRITWTLDCGHFKVRVSIFVCLSRYAIRREKGLSFL